MKPIRIVGTRAHNLQVHVQKMTLLYKQPGNKYAIARQKRGISSDEI